MIPVALRLQNFMSYGTDAPVLDFEQFQVACLSGRNGQGKSALLDAITWALWGEARKSSGPGKPDDGLLRIGQRDMQVEFTFDVEGERYRVVRSYIRSATGKTSRSNLELTVYEAEGDHHRPLTSGSMRETQQHIDRVVGLDYETFINSSFLLQGRSDEFTKKSPMDRKAVLAKVLNLSRYDRLSDLAAERERTARQQKELADQEIIRLQEALEDEPHWKAQHAEIAAQIAEQQTLVTQFRAEERDLAQQRTKYEVTERETEAIQRELADLSERLGRHQQISSTWRSRIQQAEAILVQRDSIQRDFERYQMLQQERNTLDGKNELFRGLEKQVERVERDLHTYKNDLERQLDKATLEGRTSREALAQCEIQLKERRGLSMKLEKAEEAQSSLRTQNEVRHKREAIQNEMDQLERSLHGQKEALTSQYELLNVQLERERKALPNLALMQAERSELEARGKERESLVEKLASVEVRGKDIAERMREQAALLATKSEDLARLQTQQANIGEGIDGTICPTCGSPLDEVHRAKAAQHFETAIVALERVRSQLERELEHLKKDRDAFREQYKALLSTLKPYESVPEQLSRLAEQLRQGHERKARLEEDTVRLNALQEQIEGKTFGELERSRFLSLKAELSRWPFDEEVYSQVLREASQVDRFKEELRRLEEVAGRKEQLQNKAERADLDASNLRELLERGDHLRALQAQITRLQLQIQQVGFNPARFREVRKALDELRAAPERMTGLVNAQQNHVEWQGQLEENEVQVKALTISCGEKEQRLSELNRLMEGRDTLEQDFLRKGQQCLDAEHRLQILQKQAGQVGEKLEQAGRDRKALHLARRNRKQTEQERTLYKHLRGAFGKHGIPSLIIEQTLPEIEDRTNELLERLTDGRMHIRLETLKDKKTGGTKETLEIQITDEQGVSRPYETFSGGEAFRVNFALRVALAQLLAERSGVRIRTLVVDEGFGTQDDQGVQNLVEAINLVQDDFDKILVITHLKELKEAFPVRIEVEKDPAVGSRFEVLGV